MRSPGSPPSGSRWRSTAAASLTTGGCSRPSRPARIPALGAALARLPALGAGLSLVGTLDLGRHPAAIEGPALRRDQLLAQIARVHPACVEGDVPPQPLEVRAGVGVMPGGALCPGATCLDVHVLGAPLPLAERVPALRFRERLLAHVGAGDVDGRRAGGFEHAQGADAVRQNLVAQLDPDPPGLWLDARGTRVVPDRFLGTLRGSRCHAPRLRRRFHRPPRPNQKPVGAALSNPPPPGPPPPPGGGTGPP